jgi:hypothetical protein
MPQSTAEALHRAIVRADMRVARLRIVSRLRAALDRSRDRADDQLQSAERNAKRLHDMRTLLAFGGRRRRATP